MKDNKSIIIIGSGRRTQQDILPVLEYLNFPNQKIEIYAKNKKSIFSRNQYYHVKSFDECKKIKNEDLVYIAVSKDSQLDILDSIYRINKNVFIIIDTPANNSLLNYDLLKKICIAEDVIQLLHVLDQREHYKKSFFNYLYFHKSAFKYHAIAFIEYFNGPIKFQLKFLGFQLHVSKNGIAVIIGKRNYEKGEIYLNFKKMQFPILLNKEKKLIGGLSEKDSFSGRFLELKRIGLADLVKKMMNNHISVQINQGINHVKKAKIMENFFGIKFYFKRHL